MAPGSLLPLLGIQLIMGTRTSMGGRASVGATGHAWGVMRGPCGPRDGIVYVGAEPGRVGRIQQLSVVVGGTAFTGGRFDLLIQLTL